MTWIHTAQGTSGRAGDPAPHDEPAGHEEGNTSVTITEDAKKKRRGERLERGATLVTAAIASAVAAQGMYVFFHDELHMPGPLLVMCFSFIELMVVTSAMRARRSQLDTGSAGVDGIAMWVLTIMSGILAATHADSVGVLLLRLLAPLIAAWGWERSMALERRQLTGRTGGINWRWSPTRLLVRWGIADPTDRTTAEIAVERRLADLARAADAVRLARTTGRSGRRERQMIGRLHRAIDKATDDGLVLGEPAIRERLRAHLEGRFSAYTLPEYVPVTNWAAPGGPVLDPGPGGGGGGGIDIDDELARLVGAAEPPVSAEHSATLTPALAEHFAEQQSTPAVPEQVLRSAATEHLAEQRSTATDQSAEHELSSLRSTPPATEHPVEQLPASGHVALRSTPAPEQSNQSLALEQPAATVPADAEAGRSTLVEHAPGGLLDSSGAVAAEVGQGEQPEPSASGAATEQSAGQSAERVAPFPSSPGGRAAAAPEPVKSAPAPEQKPSRAARTEHRAERAPEQQGARRTAPQRAARAAAPERAEQPAEQFAGRAEKVRRAARSRLPVERIAQVLARHDETGDGAARIARDLGMGFETCEKLLAADAQLHAEHADGKVLRLHRG
ncbi:hypothetical protein REK76_29380 (plasmid) [Nocardia farcinica]|uniref:hypothetical protein n=1 Tax=Nocardia farcinica TaxID=37329 RepID=UPI0018945CB8|nr:hypothetical protein [Nocardia farcinica]MBF6284499.1 hypothetical protein [Nocardia farcinica]